MSGQRHAPAALYTGKDPVRIVQEAGWDLGSVWTDGEKSRPPGFDPRTVQPVDSRNTYWATPAHGPHVKCQLFLSDFNETRFLDGF